MTLSDTHRAILDFEQSAWWKYAGAKEAAIRERFDMNATQYYQLLGWLIKQPEAEAYAPTLVRRLRRLRDQRRAFRTAERRLVREAR